MSVLGRRGQRLSFANENNLCLDGDFPHWKRTAGTGVQSSRGDEVDARWRTAGLGGAVEAACGRGGARGAELFRARRPAASCAA